MTERQRYSPGPGTDSRCTNCGALGIDHDYLGIAPTYCHTAKPTSQQSLVSAIDYALSAMDDEWTTDEMAEHIQASLAEVGLAIR